MAPGRLGGISTSVGAPTSTPAVEPTELRVNIAPIPLTAPLIGPPGDANVPTAIPSLSTSPAWTVWRNVVADVPDPDR